MNILSGYQVLHENYSSASTKVYKAQRSSDGLPVILKVLQDDHFTAKQLSRYKQEYDISKSIQSDSVIKPYKFEVDSNRCVIIFEYFSGKTLADYVAHHQLSLFQKLRLGSKIAEGLAEIHESSVIHKDINPGNIVINESMDQLKIIDFSHSSLLPKEQLGLVYPSSLDGTLLYIAPEQTGRMNRMVDYRADFYSLGVTLYELFVGKVPFEADDPIELVHCHIAKLPTPPIEKNGETPKVVSDIIMKLLSKTAEERYHTGWGIKADFDKCLELLSGSSNDQIAVFDIAAEDVPNRFQLAEKLYGREEEVQLVLKLFGKVSDIGCRELLLVAGYSGVGKTSLIREVYRPMTKCRGYFVSGKFDQYCRDKPYSAVIDSFRELARQLLTETEERIAQWKEKILEAVGINGQIIIDVIPEVRLIINDQEEVESLGAAESRVRFEYTLSQFIGIFCHRDHPLVVFWDDLQWADTASLELVERLITDEKFSYLFLIGAYRDNEVDDSHPLILTLKNIVKQEQQYTSILLAPLGAKHVAEFVADSLKEKPSEVRELSALVQNKTGGNPFFIEEFLKSLYSDQLIKFEAKKNRWTWSLEEIEARGITDNVVELMAGKISDLGPDVNRVLNLASCIGNIFDLSILAGVYGKTEKDTAQVVLKAIKVGLILPLGEAYKLVQVDEHLEKFSQKIVVRYRFSHDRIQQAAHSLIEEEEQREIHFQIGNLLVRKYKDNIEEYVFEITNQLNMGCSLIENDEQRFQLVNLNVLSARKAKQSIAYDLANKYISVGIDLMGQELWVEKYYQTTLDLFSFATEVAYLTQHYARMDECAEQVLNHCHETVEMIPVYESLMNANTAQEKNLRTVEIGLEVLGLLGIKLHPNPGPMIILKELALTKWMMRNRSMDDLLNLPALTDPEKLSTLRVFSCITTSAYLMNPELTLVMALKCMQITLKHGMSSLTAYAVSVYALITSGVLRNYDKGFEYGKLAQAILDKQGEKKYRPYSEMIVLLMTHHWKIPLRDDIGEYERLYKLSMEIGSLFDAALNCSMPAFFKYILGDNLDEVFEESQIAYDASVKLGQSMMIDRMAMILQFLSLQLGKEPFTETITGKYYNEEVAIADYVETKNLSGVLATCVFKQMYLYVFQRIESAYDLVPMIEKYMLAGLSNPVEPLAQYYVAVSLASYYPKLSIGKKIIARIKMRRYLRKLQLAAKHCPENYLFRVLGLKAEINRCLGNSSQATYYYNRTIKEIRPGDYNSDRAVILERMGTFHLQLDEKFTAKCLIQASIAAFRAWGCKPKVEILQKEHRRLLKWQGYEEVAVAEDEQSSDSIQDVDVLMKTAQTLSKEIVLSRMVDRLMKLLIENAGAEKAVLILKHGAEGKGVLKVEAGISINKEFTEVCPLDLELSKQLPIAIARYVAKTNENLILDNAGQASTFSQDDYIQLERPKSIICAPLLKQNELLGILYLENNQATGVFTPDRVEVLKFICSQAAIAIENAKLYGDLEASEDKYRSIFENSNEGILRLSKSGTFIAANGALATLLNYPSAETLVSERVNVADFLMGEIKESLIYRLNKNKAIYDYETQVIRQGGERCYVELSVHSVIDKEGNLKHFEGTVRDISQRKRAEMMKVQKDSAEAATEAKSQFLASMSHEIRTPMNGVIGIVDLLRDTPLNKSQSRYLDIIHNSGHALLDIINDVLDYSKIEAGKMELENISFDLFEVIENAACLFIVKAKDKNLELISTPRPGTPRYVFGDPARLRQIIINLMGNSFKFTEQGQVWLTVQPSEADKTKLLFRISDTGIGIAKDNIGKIFESYGQAEGDTARKFGGTGLGLNICQQLVQLMGGEIGIESELGEGSTFWFTMNAEPDNDCLNKEDQANLETLVQQHRLFYVDSNATYRELMAEYCSSHGLTTTVAGCFEEAFNSLTEIGDDVTLMIVNQDIEGGSGLEFCQKVELEYLRQKAVKLIYVHPPAKELSDSELESYSITESFEKPLSVASLFDRSMEILAPKSLSSKREEDVHEVDFSRLRVLVAEDNVVNQVVIKKMLEKIGSQCHLTPDGGAAYEYYVDHYSEIDVILMDCQMPVMDGYETTEKIREFEAQRGLDAVPILALTAHAMSDNKDACMKVGMNDVITKPIVIKTLKERLAFHIAM